MEEKINIAEILKDKKNGLRLYSPIFGECTFCCVREDTNDICVKKHNGVKEFFDSKGLYSILGEVMIFPSKEMHDWEKFSWKRGDVLISDCGFVCIFKEWASDDYTPFIKAFGEGKDIEMRSKNPHAQLNGWAKMDEFIFGNFEYRIKPEPKYRPFANAEECWVEMLKHKPFGLVKSTLFKDFALVNRVTTLYVEINRDIIDYKDALEKFTFADDNNFGVKEEK